MHISSGITQYLMDVTFTKWTIHNCLEFLAENCAGVTSEHREEIMAEIKHQLHLTSTHNSMNKKAREKATKLFNGVERYFQFKEVIAFFDQMDKKVNNACWYVLFGLYIKKLTGYRQMKIYLTRKPIYMDQRLQYE